MKEFSEGTKVQYSDGRAAVVRYSGTTHFSTGHWIGIELEDETGKNDGSVKGQRYFACAPSHGMFVRPETISTILQDPPPENEAAPARPFNGIERRSRQSIMSAEAARRRQSLMGSGTSRSTPPSRSPTKSPTKLGPSHRASSDHSASRTASPSTTARTSNSSARSRLSVSAFSSMGPPPPPGSKAQVRQSFGGVPAKTQNPGLSLAASRNSARLSTITADRSSLATSQEQSPTPSMASQDSPISPPMDAEEHKEAEGFPIGTVDVNVRDDVRGDTESQGAASRSLYSQPQRKQEEASGLVSGISNSSMEPKARLATGRELEQLKAKYTIMERKRMEDRDKLRAVDGLREERDRFESIVQKLQRKCLTQSQEISEWRKQLQESDAKMENLERTDAEHGTEAEMATLDKEMAEERLEVTSDELEKLKEKFEELQLETEILRDENKELTAGMTSTERSNAGWIQMEKENRRLRDALVALREMTQETEAGLRNHVKELEQDLSQVEGIKPEHEKLKAEMAASRGAMQTLKENMDAVENQELLVAELGDAKEALVEQVQGLSTDMEVLKAEIDDERNLRASAEEGERLLQDEFDAVQEIARYRHQTMLDMEKVIADRDETLSKFAGIVHGLQRELRGLQASQQTSESEALQLSAASRDVMDLNRRLQDTAHQTQARSIDSELTRIKSEDAAFHLSILEQFIPDSFDGERDQVLALLRFKSIASKAEVLRKVVTPATDSVLETSQDQIYLSFDMMERLHLVAASCSRSSNFMQSCTLEQFSRFGSAYSEAEAVERLLDAMLDAAKRRDLDCAQWTEKFERIPPLLSDLADKTIPAVPAAFAEKVTGSLSTTQQFSEISAREMGLIHNFLQTKVVHHEEDQDQLDLMQEVQRLLDRSRMGPVVAGKVRRAFEEHHKRSMTVGEESLELFERTESMSMDLSRLLRLVGQGLWKLSDDDTNGGEAVAFAEASGALQISAKQWDTSSETTDVLVAIADLLSGLHSNLETVYNLVSNLSNYSEFERHPAPWTVRAKILVQQKVVDPQMEEQLRKSQNEAHEQTVAISIKTKEIEEQGLKIEFLEARTKGLKQNTAALQKLENDLTAMVEQRDNVAAELDKLMKEYKEISRKHDEANMRLAAIDQGGLGTGDGALALMDGHTSLSLSTAIDTMKDEISNLQSAARFLKAENHRLLHPASAAATTTTATARSSPTPTSNHAWLTANPLPTRLNSGNATRSPSTASAIIEARDIFTTLRRLSSVLKPVRLQHPLGPRGGSGTPDDNNDDEKNNNRIATTTTTTWRPLSHTPRYIVARQRRELESWMSWRDDLVARRDLGRGGDPGLLSYYGHGYGQSGSRSRSRSRMSWGKKGTGGGNGDGYGYGYGYGCGIQVADESLVSLHGAGADGVDEGVKKVFVGIGQDLAIGIGLS